MPTVRDREYLRQIKGICQGCVFADCVEYDSRFIQICGVDPDTNPERVLSAWDCPILCEILLHDTPNKCIRCASRIVEHEAGGPEVGCKLDECWHKRKYTGGANGK